MCPFSPWHNNQTSQQKHRKAQTHITMAQVSSVSGDTCSPNDIFSLRRPPSSPYLAGSQSRTPESIRSGRCRPRFKSAARPFTNPPKPPVLPLHTALGSLVSLGPATPGRLTLSPCSNTTSQNRHSSFQYGPQHRLKCRHSRGPCNAPNLPRLQDKCNVLS